jgi:hypothetical protein
MRLSVESQKPMLAIFHVLKVTAWRYKALVPALISVDNCVIGGKRGQFFPRRLTFAGIQPIHAPLFRGVAGSLAMQSTTDLEG